MIPPLTKNYMKTPELQKDIATQYKLEQSGEIDKIIHLNFAPPSHRFPECIETPKSTSPALSNTEIVDSTVVVTKNVDKYISQILKQYIKETDHYIKNSKDFVNKCRDMKVETDETLILYDVMPLYPSVPQREAFQVFHHELIPNNILETKMKPESMIKLLKHVCKLRISYSTGDCTSKSMTLLLVPERQVLQLNSSCNVLNPNTFANPPSTC